MTKKARILFIHHGTLHGGAPLSLLYTAIGVRGSGYDVSIGLVRPDSDLREFYEGHGFPTFHLPFIHCYYYWAAAPQYWHKGHTYRNLFRALLNWSSSKRLLAKFLKENRFDLVHLNSVSLINSAIAMLNVGQKFVWHIREYGPLNRDWRHSFFKNVMLESGNLIFLSQAERKSWLQSDVKGTVVHNFIDLNQFCPDVIDSDIREQYKISPSTSVLLFLGGFKQHKGIDIVLEVASKLALRGVDFRLVMPGTLLGGESKYESVITDRGLSEHCILEAFIPDVRPFFKGADILLFPAEVPHFARPVIEAAAMKVPTVATNLPPMDELILKGRTGSLFEKGDVDDFTEKVMELITNSTLKKRMGDAGRAFAREKFEAQSQIDKILKIYEGIL